MASSSMDRPRTTAKKRPLPLLLSMAAAVLALLFLTTLRPADASVDRSAVAIDTVRRGTFVHEIAASGSLVAEQPRLISAPTAGRVEVIRAQPGDHLQTGDLILELANRDTLRQLLEVEQQLAGAESDLADLEATLQAQSLERESSLRRTVFEREDARRQAEATAELARQGLISSLEAQRHHESAEELTARAESEGRRHQALDQAAGAQLAAQRNRRERLRALQSFHQAMVDSLTVRAPAAATVRDVPVEQGEWVLEGQRLARLVEPGRLKAVLLVPEAVAHEVREGQSVALRARGVTLAGHVSRIAAAVEQGTLAADITLEGDLPSGARPDLSLDGRIEIARLDNVLVLRRPTNATAGATGALYRVEGNRARRINVRYGPAAVDQIVIEDGAKEGDGLVVAGIEGRSEETIRLE